MRVVISQELLSTVLSTVSKAVSRSINPVLNHVHVVVSEDSIQMTATDGEFTIRRTVAVSGAVPGSFLAPADLLSKLVGKLPKKDVTLTVENNQLNVNVGRSSYDLTIMVDDNFPSLAEYGNSLLTSIPASLLKHALQQTTFSAVKDSSTGAVHYTNGVFFVFRGARLDIVATDGHRLALKRNEGLQGQELEQNLLLPARVADELEKMLPDDEDSAVAIYNPGNQVAFSFGSQLVVCSLLDVKFPDYERVIPKDITTRVFLEKTELSEALQRVQLVCRTRDQNPVAHIESSEDKIDIRSDAGEVGKGVEELAAQIEGGEIRIALNPEYIIQVLRNLPGDQVVLNWINEVNPVLVSSPRDPDYLYIVMPIRMD
jgi:DNA polymerase-3 subunit beta